MNTHSGYTHEQMSRYRHGAIEAVSMDTAPGFLLGVQWHPEWKHAENPVSRAIFKAFGDALRDQARGHRDAPAPALSG